MKKKVKVDKNLIKKMFNMPQKKLDKELIELMLKNIINRVQQKHLYSESSWVIEEYNQLQYSLDALYSFIYTPHQSHLSLKDAQVFASYAVQQSKKLKDIVNILADNKIQISNQRKPPKKLPLVPIA